MSDQNAKYGATDWHRLVGVQTIERMEMELRHAQEALAWHEKFDPQSAPHRRLVVTAAQRTLDYWRARIDSSETDDA